ncbi:hypothetical protein HDU91_002699, partial [Kappamyces sp. JEL0680]
DMTQEEQVKSSIDLAVVAHGPIDVLIVSHGIWPAQDVGVKDMDYDRWQHTMNVNLGGTFLVVKHYLQQLERACQQGAGHDMLPSIVLIGSTAGKFGEAWHADYSCSKTSMMYGLILSLKNEIVRVHPKARINTVSPGWIRTPMAARAMSDPNLLYQALASSPLKKVSEPSDITQAILFLADGTKSGNITGPSGLVAIKHCLEQGLEPVCFESASSLGGIWRYTQTKDAHSSVYSSTVVNTSKEMMQFSDFPIPVHWPEFLPHTLVQEYLESYALHFDLKKYIKFGRRVASIRPQVQADGTETGNWELIYKRRDKKKTDPSLSHGPPSVVSTAALSTPPPSSPESRPTSIDRG